MLPISSKSVFRPMSKIAEIKKYELKLSACATSSLILTEKHVTLNVRISQFCLYLYVNYEQSVHMFLGTLYIRT